jgi:hypothetical protein
MESGKVFRKSVFLLIVFGMTFNESPCEELDIVYLKHFYSNLFIVLEVLNENNLPEKWSSHVRRTMPDGNNKNCLDVIWRNGNVIGKHLVHLKRMNKKQDIFLDHDIQRELVA